MQTHVGHGVLRRSRTVIETPLPSELILLNPSTGEMYSLSSVGWYIWDRLCEGSPPRQIGAQVAQSFDVDRVPAEADIREFVADLVRAGLLEAADKADAYTKERL